MLDEWRRGRVKIKLANNERQKKEKDNQLGEMTRYWVLNIKVPFYYISINDQNTLLTEVFLNIFLHNYTSIFI